MGPQEIAGPGGCTHQGPAEGSSQCKSADTEVVSTAEIFSSSGVLTKRVKAISTLRARLALLRAVLHEEKAGGFTITCGGLSRHLVDLDALQAFVDGLGSRQRA